MGMGLLGAMGGLGQAGQQIGQQMMQHALREEELSWLEERQNRMAEMAETRKKASIDDERKRLGGIYDKATSGAGVAEGPPTEGGMLPKGPMSRQEKMQAAAEAYRASGDTAQADQIEGRLQKDAATEQTLALRRDLQEQTNEIKRQDLARKQQFTDWRVNGGTAARGGSGGVAGSSRAGAGGYGGVGKEPDFGKTVDSALKRIDSLFGADKESGRPEDLYGKNAAEWMIEKGMRGAPPGTRPGDIAIVVADKIMDIRKRFSDESGRVVDVAGYKSALAELRRYQTKGEVVGDDGVVERTTEDNIEFLRDQAVPTEGGGMLSTAKPKETILPDTSSSWSLQKSKHDIYADAGVDTSNMSLPFGRSLESAAEFVDILRGAKNQEAVGIKNAYKLRDRLRAENNRRN